MKTWMKIMLCFNAFDGKNIIYDSDESIFTLIRERGGCWWRAQRKETARKKSPENGFTFRDVRNLFMMILMKSSSSMKKCSWTFKLISIVSPGDLSAIELNSSSKLISFDCFPILFNSALIVSLGESIWIWINSFYCFILFISSPFLTFLVSHESWKWI